jgi:hypothetical protein
LRCDWDEVEGVFRRFCGAHDDLIPQWYVDEYVFQAMRLWADGHIGQLLRHFANFVNRAAGTSLIDAVAEAEAVREARVAPPPPPPRRPPPRPDRPTPEELEPSPKQPLARAKVEPRAPVVRQVVDVPQAVDADEVPAASTRPRAKKAARTKKKSKSPASGRRRR